ncbi:MAG: sel1 repeat family protein [Alphaproteobacteria bacterium]|nr:sel1 repeat family protein [Alphaproteobacteria bacterium]
MDELSLKSAVIDAISYTFWPLLIGCSFVYVIRPKAKPESPKDYGTLFLAYTAFGVCIGILTKFFIEPTTNNFLSFLINLILWGLIAFILGCLYGKFFGCNEIRKLKKLEKALIKQKQQHKLRDSIENLRKELNEYEHSKDYSQLVDSGDNGNPNSQFLLGQMFDSGNGALLDQERAAYHYEIAAHQGHIDAQYETAICYDFGLGVEADMNLALKWYRMAANQGHKEAKARLQRLLSIQEA